MPNQAITEGWWAMFPILAECHTQSKAEKGLKVSSPITCSHFSIPPHPPLHLPCPGSGINTFRWCWHSPVRPEDGTSGITLMRFLTNLIAMGRVDFYPKTDLWKAEEDSVGLSAAPRRDVNFRNPPAILNLIFFTIIKKCGLEKGGLRAALTCSRQMVLISPLLL